MFVGLSGTVDSQRDSHESIRANHSQLKPLFQKRPDVNEIVLSMKSRYPPPPPREKYQFEDFILICTVFLHSGPFWGGIKPNFADKNFMDTQTSLTSFIARQADWPESLEFLIRANHATKLWTSGLL